jgi:nicotinate-nucleotide adenylyltransferase
MNWIVFGGAFDPPHLGHLQIAYALNNAFSDHKVLVIPTAASPSTGKDQMIEFKHRLEMAKLTFLEPSFEKWLEVSSLEEELPKPNFTIDTLSKMISSRPQGERPKLVLGYDQWLNFPTWKNPLKILELADLIVFPRGLPLESLPPNRTPLGLPLEWIGPGKFQLGVAKVYFLDVKVCNAASRELRATLSRRGYSPWLTPRTLDYIDKTKLYKN